MSKVDFVKDMTRAVRLLSKVARGELDMWGLMGGLGKGQAGTDRATTEDEPCTLTDGCTGVAGHDGGCVIDVCDQNEPVEPVRDTEPVKPVCDEESPPNE